MDTPNGWNVMASRKFDLRHSDGRMHTVSIELSAPLCSPEDEDHWTCHVSVTRNGERKTKAFYGVDSLQALSIGLSGATMEIEMLMTQYGPAITLDDSPDLLCGMPKILRLRDV